MAVTSSVPNAAGKMFTSRASDIFAFFILTTAFALLVVVDVTAPVNHGLALFTARNKHIQYNEGYPVVRFGTFGYCLQIYRNFSETYYSAEPPTADQCTSSSIGYSPSEALSPISSHLGYDGLSGGASLTKAMVLHPLATAFSFLVLIFSISRPKLAPLILVPLLSSLTTLLALIALICDLVLFSRVQRSLEDAADAAFGSFDTGIWLLIVAVICLVIGTVFLTWQWWFERRPYGTRRVAPGIEQDHEEGKTDRSASPSVPPYEMDIGNTAGCAEVSQRAEADRYELSGQDYSGRVELEHQVRRFELPGQDTQKGTYDNVNQGSGKA
ncbi:pali-domain-containing protein [Hypoxylon sp. FL0890]|nr:pali-domain-containing protein [Hypoxylon sp. FL0890]